MILSPQLPIHFLLWIFKVNPHSSATRSSLILSSANAIFIVVLSSDGLCFLMNAEKFSFAHTFRLSGSTTICFISFPIQNENGADSSVFIDDSIWAPFLEDGILLVVVALSSFRCSLQSHLYCILHPIL